MREVSKSIEYKGKELKLVFNLNVMEVIQDEYGAVETWAHKTDGDGGEPDIKALIFGMAAMLNEGIEIDNEERPPEDRLAPLTHKQVGRILTDLGIQNSTTAVNDIVIESTKDKSGKNE